MSHPYSDLFKFIKTSFCFHKWKLIKTGEHIQKFLNESIVYDICDIRGCPKCGTVQHYVKDDISGDMWWVPLDEKQIDVLRNKKMWDF